MTTEYSLDDIERFDRLWTDMFAKECGWETHALQDPIEDINLFFSHLCGHKMLDVGCGWGRYVPLFLDQGLDYQGIDHSAEMLKIAKETNPKADFQQGSFRTLPFPDNHFDGLWSCCSISAIPKVHLVEILQEHLRVLKPAGVMNIVMPAPPESQEGLYFDDDGNPEIYQAHYYLEEFEDYVKKAGFEIIESGHRWSNGSFYILVRRPAVGETK